MLPQKAGVKAPIKRLTGPLIRRKLSVHASAKNFNPDQPARTAKADPV